MRDRSRLTGKAKQRVKPHSEAHAMLPGQAVSRDPFAATPDKMLPFVRALASEMEQRLEAELGTPVTPSSLLAATGAAHYGYEHTWRYVQSLNMVEHDCRAGCAFCCYLTVETSAPEVFLIAERLRATRTPAQISLLKEDLRRVSSGIQGLTPTERVRAAVPRALLENGICSVHSVRPLACRSWNSRESGACERVLEEGGDLRTVRDQRPQGISAGVRAGFLAALRRAGLSEEVDRQCELNTGLLLALEHPQAVERWLGGEDILEPARTTVRYTD